MACSENEFGSAARFVMRRTPKLVVDFIAILSIPHFFHRAIAISREIPEFYSLLRNINLYWHLSYQNPASEECKLNMFSRYIMNMNSKTLMRGKVKTGIYATLQNSL